jgi:hypothetical protein
MGQVGGAHTAVFSRADKGYVRAENSDGSFRDETHSFRDGGNFGGASVDATMDTQGFDEVSRIIAASVASQNYDPSEDPASVRPLVMVYRGVTIVLYDSYPRDTRDLHASSGNLEERIDGQIDGKSANIFSHTNEIFTTSPSDPTVKTLQASGRLSPPQTATFTLLSLALGNGNGVLSPDAGGGPLPFPRRTGVFGKVGHAQGRAWIVWRPRAIPWTLRTPGLASPVRV